MNDEHPKWTGADGEVTISVAREPRRTNLVMEQTVHQQMFDYILHYTKLRPNEVAIALAVQLVAHEHITPEGSQDVVLTREQLTSFVERAMKIIKNVEESDA